MTATERDRLIMLETKVDGIDEKLDKIIADHETRIRCLESKPAKQWDTVVKTIITSIVSILVTAAITLLLTGVLK